MYTESAEVATVELFVAEGDLSITGEKARAGGFVAIPKDCGSGAMAPEGGAQVFLWWTPESSSGYDYNSQICVTNVVSEAC